MMYIIELSSVHTVYDVHYVLLQESCGPLFKKITHNQFSSHLLTPSLKCLLRNPDELLEGTCIHTYVHDEL